MASISETKANRFGDSYAAKHVKGNICLLQNYNLFEYGINKCNVFTGNDGPQCFASEINCHSLLSLDPRQEAALDRAGPLTHQACAVLDLPPKTLESCCQARQGGAMILSQDDRHKLAQRALDNGGNSGGGGGHCFDGSCLWVS